MMLYPEHDRLIVLNRGINGQSIGKNDAENGPRMLENNLSDSGIDWFQFQSGFVILSASMFTWIPFHKETATKLLEFKDQSPQLAALINRMHEAGLKALPNMDKEADGSRIPLRKR